VVGFYFLFIAGQLGFQYLYYGEWLPNTYALKLMGMPLAARINNGIGFVTPFLIVTAFILFLSMIDMIVHFQKRKLFLLSIVYSAIAYQIYVGGDPWVYWRMMAPAMPLAIILFIVSLHSFIHALSATHVFRDFLLRNPKLLEKNITRTLVVSLTLIGLLLANIRFLLEISLLVKPFTVEFNRINVNTAIALNQVTTNDATIGVFWAGTIPYYTDRKAIDFLGKSDKYIAHLPPDMTGAVGWNGMTSVPGHNKYDLNYSIRSLEPTYVQGLEWGSQDLSQWAETWYVKIKYKGVILYLLIDSPSVRWDKINST
jgi:hypothetical protein